MGIQSGLRWAVLALLFSLGASAHERLLLVGGGDSPQEANARFVEWAGGSRAHLLVITWGSEAPNEAFQATIQEFYPFHPEVMSASFVAPKTPQAKIDFFLQLADATAVFFAGGDQVLILDALEDEELRVALESRYHSGTPFGGTSAGTAIMSPITITRGDDVPYIDGEKIPQRKGFGLLPGVIVDQHFVKRSRENRLFGVVLQHPEYLGVGINQESAITIENGKCGEVFGEGPVMLVDPLRIPGSLTLTLLAPGEKVDLHARVRTDSCQSQ